MKSAGKVSMAITAVSAVLAGGIFLYKRKKHLEPEDEEERQRRQYAAELYLPKQAELLRKDLLQEMQLDIKLMEEHSIVHVDHLTEWCGDTDDISVNPLLLKDEEGERLGLPLKSLVPPGSFCIKDFQFENEEELKQAERYMKAGPKRYMYFRKNEVKAAIVTCGGLCPGLNVVIREIVMTLWWNYNVRKILGVRWGYSGFYETGENYVELTPDNVKEIQQLGGSILGAGRDTFHAEKIFNALLEHEINQVYIIGGDGTHKGILELSKLIKKRSARISLVGVPKTIDNDIKVIDYSFGFSSAIQAAAEAISSATVEATCVKNGIGLLKLMGRDVGHIAMHASLASREVNICLVPEFKFNLDGKEGLLNYIFDKVLKNIGHCVIVVAEGAALGVNDRKLVKEGEDPRNVNIGLLLKNEILAYAKQNNLETTLKYIDPSYIIRTVPANGADRQYCSVLAQNAVHGAMAGFTNFTSGSIREVSVNLPIDLIANGEKNKLVYEDRAWQRLLASTNQPSFIDYA
jgi:6-phosphofructokinase 1